jgi:hypothetical protein
MIPAAPVPPKVLEELVDRVRKGDCILFLGAGVHAPPPEGSAYRYPEAHRPPMGSALANVLAKDCEFEKTVPRDSISDLQRVSLCYETTRGLGRKSLVDALVKHLAEGKEPSPALRMLTTLPFKILITTNYDPLLERALRACGKQVEPLIYDPSPATVAPDPSEDPSPDRPLLYKIHGDLTRRESVVITDEDYIGFVQRMSEKEQTHPVPATVRYRMLKWPMLFLGYSLRDYNLRLLIRTLRWKVDPVNFPSAYSVDPYPDPLILRVWQEERRYVTFFAQNLWTFAPWLYREVVGQDFPTDERPVAA